MTLAARSTSHRRLAVKGDKTAKYVWLADLMAIGLFPRVVILAQCDPIDSSSVERRWVRRLGVRFPLLNEASAGAGNPGIGRVAWTPEIDAMLGVEADSTIANMLGCNRKTVSYRRECLGLSASFNRTNNKPPPYMGGWQKVTLPEHIMQALGTVPDYVLCEMAGVSKKVIGRVRDSLGIKSYAEATGNNGRIKHGEPHRRWSRPDPTPQISLSL